jgi:hypothetical protein
MVCLPKLYFGKSKKGDTPMGLQNSSSYESQTRRQAIKTISQQMKQLAVAGTGISPWEAEVLVQSIEDVYFSNTELCDLKHGQTKYNCVSAAEGAGKPLKDCQMVTVVLTLLDNSDEDELLATDNKQRQNFIRRRKVTRMADEAKDQGGLLSQEDIATLLGRDVKTIQRDVKGLKELGIIVPTRGQQKDIGPGVTHRELVIRHWVDGKEPVDVARQTKHSIAAVESYIEKFKVVVYLRSEKNFSNHEISVVAGMSARGVKAFLEIYEEKKSHPLFKHRLDEITLRGSQYYNETGEKKDSSQLNSSTQGWMKL